MYSFPLSSLSLGVAILKGSVSDSHIIEYIFNHYPDINAVVHCAAYTSSFNDYNEEPLRGAENNLKSIVSLLDTLVKHKVSPWLVSCPAPSLDEEGSGDTRGFFVTLRWNVSAPIRLLHARVATATSGQSLQNGALTSASSAYFKFKAL